MADIILKTIVPATNFDLLTLDELKIALGITGTTEDAYLGQLIDVYSDVIATMCNRVFAAEKMKETWRDLEDNRLFLSHYPIKQESDIELVSAPRGSTLVAGTDYEIELKSGKILLLASKAEPIEATYTGGYTLPNEAPNALKQAVTMLIRYEKSTANQLAVQGIRSLSHKESRIIYFDPNKSSSSVGSGSLSGILQSVNNLLMHYVRIQV